MEPEPSVLQPASAKSAGPTPGVHGVQVAVVIPCYKVTRFVEDVIARVGPEVWRIYCVDDACPDGSGDRIEKHVSDPRVRVLRNAENQGVGGATLAGFRQARADGADVLVKIDGDGQMDPRLLPLFLEPILAGRADYTKGNRFYDPSSVHGMPFVRVVGNAGVSFLNKLSSGYWNIFDPTNGYVALHGLVLDRLPVDKISRRYFFESDMLYHLNIVRAVVEDVPMEAVYGEEESNLHVASAGPDFVVGHARNFLRRLAYNYYLRDFSMGSIELVLGPALLLFGVVFGTVKWALKPPGLQQSAGTVMLAGLPVIVGLQLILSFLNGDANNVPRTPLHRRIEG